MKYGNYVEKSLVGWIAGILVGIYCCSNGWHALGFAASGAALGLIYATFVGVRG